MAFMRDVIVLRLGTEVSSLGDAGFAKQIQSAVNGGEPQVRIFLGKLVVHGLGRDVFLSKERRQDQFALAGQFQLMFGQVLTKHVHFFEGFAHSV